MQEHKITGEGTNPSPINNHSYPDEIVKTISALFNLQYMILRNQHRRDIAIKFKYDIIILMAFSVLCYSSGYSLGYLFRYLYTAEKYSDLNTIENSAVSILLVFILANFLSYSKFPGQITYNNLRFMPIGLFYYTFIDLIFSTLNKVNILMLLFLSGIATNISSSLVSFTYLTLLVLSLIIFIQVFIETVHAVIRLIGAYTVSLLVFVLIFIIIAVFNENISIFVLQSPAGEVIHIMRNYISYGATTNLTGNILLNICYGAAGIYTCYFINLISYSSVSERITEKKYFVKFDKTAETLLQNTAWYSYFLVSVKYLIRGTRTSSQIILEVVFIVFMFLGYYYKLEIIPYNIYIVIFIASIFPVLLWDFYLSNQWGYEKKGFGLYLFAPVNYREIVVAKNLSYFVLKLPSVLTASFLTGLLISVKLALCVFALLIIINTLMMIIANYNSIRYAYPVNISERLLSKNSRNAVFSLAGFLYLLLLWGISSFLLMILWKIGETFTILLIYFVAAAITVGIYQIMLNKSINEFSAKLGSMYSALKENE